VPERIVRKVLDLGPHPVLIARYGFHHLLASRRRRNLRRRYSELVAAAPQGVLLEMPPLVLPSVHELPVPLRPAAERIRREANHVLDHCVDILGSGLTALGEQIDWLLDFRSGYRWPRRFYQDVTPTRLDDTSDAKVPWELSRSHHLLTLARAACLFEDERYAEELERQLRSWLEENPPGKGINWTNPMEVALRAVNWVWAARTLEQFRPLERQLRADLGAALFVHARHIETNLEGTPQLRSNHYLSDILGLLVVGATLHGHSAPRRFFRKATHAFEREILQQVHDDGIGFEASLPYHGLALEIFLLATVIAGWRGHTFSASYRTRLGRMLAASLSLRHPGGRWPQIGDSDSGRVLPAGFARPASIDNLLWLGAALLGEARPDPAAPHEEVAWTLGIDPWLRASRPAHVAEPRSCNFPHGGFFALSAECAHVVVRCGDVGQNGNGGHAHNDLLSFELSYGTPLVVDSGTYVYTSDPVSRNAFRSTAAHNTVVVANAEINPFVAHELFKLRQVAHPRLDLWEERRGEVRLIASHDGYRRLEPAVVHRRSFSLDRTSGELQLRDELLGKGRQDAQSFLHLAPGTRVRRTGEGAFQLTRDAFVVDLDWWGMDRVDVAEGWVSDSFGTREPAPALVAEVSGGLPLSFGYRFSPSRRHGAAEEQPSLAATSH
jgi:hypothetical protein